MKPLNRLTTLLLWSAVSTIPALNASDDVIVYLVDPEDSATIEQLGAHSLLEQSDETPEVPTPPPQPKGLSEEAEKRLDDLIRKIQERGGDNDRTRRLADQVQKDQQDFIKLLAEFTECSVNKRDLKSSPDFVELSDKLVDLVFKAPTLRDYYERLWLINAVWLENTDEVERFEFLDRALHDQSLKQEHRQRRIRSILIGVGSVAGLAIGGYLSFKASEKILPVVANETGLASLAKYAGRTTIILIGAGVGASAGAYFGFLGSGFVFEHQREFLDPIEGNEDLRDILDYLDDVESKSGI